MTPVLGVLADRFGRKRILIPSLLMFGIAGGACALARDFNLLLGLRFLQGMGAASLGSLNVTLIGDLYSGDRRAAAMGYNASVLSVGTASYPAVGGVLATFAWYYPFVLPLVAVPLGFLILFSLKNPEPKAKLSFKKYMSQAWNSIKRRRVMVLLAASSITFIILYGSYLTYFPFLAGRSFQVTPLIIGLMMSVMSLTTAVTSSQLGKLAKKYSKNNLIKTGYAVYGTALIVFLLVPKLWMLIIPSVNPTAMAKKVCSEIKPCRWAAFPPMVSDCMTCTEISGNGPMTGMVNMMRLTR
ncbi:MAG: MFS transporter [Candidatus Aminicenantes bacterium]